jgi:EAL domain-containing protein (putative c-di-GMP-specific phosphodiesterase class I)/GGDEF domain-containing protein
MLDNPSFESFEEYVYKAYLREFDIDYTWQNLLDKAFEQQLNQQDIVANYMVNHEALEIIFKAIPTESVNPALERLFILIATWPEQLDVSEYTQRINLCINTWIEGVRDGTSLNHILPALKCLSIIAKPLNLKNQHWHAYLADLLIETVFLYQNSQIKYLLNHDGITHLPNTNLLLEKIQTKVNTGNIANINLLNIRFLIDRGATSFSPIIPTKLSNTIADLLTSILTIEHSVYQSSNLLFSILIETEINVTKLKFIIAKIQRCFEQMISLDNQVFLVSPIIGAAIYDQATIDQLPIFNQARLALNYALASKQNYILYNHDIYLKIEEKRALELDVTTAFNNEDLTLYLQPIVSLPDNQCIGAEVLLRWPNAPNKGIYPNIMVEIINAVGLGKMFTRWLINSVCRLSHELKHEHKLDLYLTLNLRAEDLYDSDLPYLIYQSTQFWKINAQDIVLEITENGILEENEITNNVIKQLTEYGFKLAIDDFGTGYSSMSRLRNMPISLIKIDQSFVTRIAESKEDFHMVQTMAQLAIGLGKEVLVEGVETLEGLDLINQIGIKKAQGYYFSRPIPYDAFITWAKNNTSQ